MPTKHNKLRYQSKDKNRPRITLTGKIYLQYRDEEEIKSAAKGDLLLYPSVEALHTLRMGEYESTGYSGYFKVDIWDGREWKPVILQELFPGREHYFSKSERPLDTFYICEDILARLQGRQVERTYREHFELVAADAEKA